MPAEHGPSGTGHDTAPAWERWAYEPDPRCERDGCQNKPTPTDPPVAVPGPASAKEREYGFEMTRSEVGLAIDGVAKLVDPTHQEAAPLLRRLQALYALSRELEPTPGPASESPAEPDRSSSFWNPEQTERRESADTPGLATAFNRHYTQVCRCEWNDEGPAGGSRETTSADCVIHGSTPDPLDALLAVGERDKADLEAAESLAAMHEGRAQSLAAEVERLDTERERDRQQIARLTEALERIAVEISPSTLAASLSADQHVAALWEVVRHYSAIARAVLAGEEDAGDE